MQVLLKDAKQFFTDLGSDQTVDSSATLKATDNQGNSTPCVITVIANAPDGGVDNVRLEKLNLTGTASAITTARRFLSEFQAAMSDVAGGDDEGPFNIEDGINAFSLIGSVVPDPAKTQQTGTDKPAPFNPAPKMP